MNALEYLSQRVARAWGSMVYNSSSVSAPAQGRPSVLPIPIQPPLIRGVAPQLVIQNGMSSLFLVWYTGLLAGLWLLLVRLKGNDVSMSCDS